MSTVRPTHNCNQRRAVAALYRQAREEAAYMRTVPWYDADTGDIIYVRVWADTDANDWRTIIKTEGRS